MAISLDADATPEQAPLSSVVNPQLVLEGAASSLVAPTVAIGEIDWPSKVNQIGAMVDAAALCLGPGLISGFAITTSGVSLNVTVAGGVAMLNGVLAIKTFAPYTCPASASRVWLYLKQDGTLDHRTTTTPIANALLLCSFPTDGAGVSGAVDYSGVLYLRGGLVWRQTADAGAPSDTLDAAMRVFTKTAGGLYLWDGAGHVEIG